MCFKPNLSPPRMFWLVKVSRSHFKRKYISVSPVVAQANHMSGFTCLQLLQPCLADAASRQAQTWILLSTTWAKREQEVKTYDLFSLPGLLKAESGCLSSNYILGFGFFHFSRSSVHAGIQHKCILREYRLCTTHYIQWGIALIWRKSLVNFQP